MARNIKHTNAAQIYSNYVQTLWPEYQLIYFLNFFMDLIYSIYVFPAYTFPFYMDFWET